MILVASLLALAAAPINPSIRQPSCGGAKGLRSVAPDPAGGAARRHAFQNGGANSLKLMWAGLDGKRTELATIPPGGMRSFSTWRGHVFELTDTDDRCVKAVRIGDVLSGTYLGTSRYRARPIRDWHVFIDQALPPKNGETRTGLATLDKMFGEIERVLPAAALARVSRTPIFLHRRAGYVGSFHYDPAWLVAHGRTVEMTEGVEIPDQIIFSRVAQHQPGILLHELAHGYHNRLSEADRAAIEVAYQNARARGLYRNVTRLDGSVGDAYALTDAREYFAELTEAWFIRNDYAPFTRTELEAYDPEGAALVARIWSAPTRSPSVP